jgi:hypothetical protein
MSKCLQKYADNYEQMIIQEGKNGLYYVWGRGTL